jgi:hypothetical protein
MRDRVREIARRVFTVVLLFVVLRVAVGVAFIAFDGGVARGLELTIICAVAAVVYIGVALAVRWWSPRPAS